MDINIGIYDQVLWQRFFFHIWWTHTYTVSSDVWLICRVFIFFRAACFMHSYWCTLTWPEYSCMEYWVRLWSISLLTANIQCFYTKEKPIPRTCLVMEPVLQSCYHWNLGMDKWFHLTLYTVLDMWLLIHAVIKVNQVSMAASSNINKYPGRYICATAYLCLHLEPLHWCHNERESVSNHQPLECLFNCLIRHR